MFELLAYMVGFQLLRRGRSQRGDGVPIETRVWLLVAGVAGAAVGAKVLFWLEDPGATWAHRFDPSWLFAGRTIVGGLLGGWSGVEAAKWATGLERSTGDLFVTPLVVGIAVGRVGCFFSGVEDGTHGIVTGLPLGMDLGDGLPRHPTALYEIGVLAVLGLALQRWDPLLPGDRFLGFMAGYLAFRFVVEWLKLQPAVVGPFSSIQLACLVGLAYTAGVAWSRHR